MTAPTLVALLLFSLFFPRAATAEDEPDELMPGNVATIQPGALAKFVAKPSTDSVFALAGAANDPTVEGAVLGVFDTMPGAGDDLYALPVQPAPLGWTGLGSPPGSKGYKYRGAGTPADPCKVVIVKPKVVKAVCKGSGITLAPPFVGDLGVVLTLGSDSKSYCTTFGGVDLKNDTTALKRKVAPAPLSCPVATPPVPEGIFVDTLSGADGNPGTMFSPRKTIQAGIAAASAGGDQVHVSKGFYAESITLFDGVSILGGYDASSGWTSSPANVVTIAGATTAVIGTSIFSPTELRDLTILSSSSTTPGGSSYGVYLTSSTGLSLDGVTIEAGNGDAGAAGTAGSLGAGGTNGGQGNPGCENSGGVGCTTCSQPAGGTAGTSACGRTGGIGGAPGLGLAGGQDGGIGTGGTTGGPGAPSSAGNGQAGSDGSPGVPGANGSGGAAFGTALLAGYVPAGGLDGADGSDGDGGGGGGGGGGGTVNCDSYGSSGGGGGGGGCKGSSGNGGSGGGGSFGLYLFNSTISITQSQVETGNGGAGGNGGDGGDGGTAGAAGPGGPYGGSGEQDDGGNGAAGGDGGNGGQGGNGGGGGGGPSIAVSCAGGSSLSLNSGNTFLPGTGGSGGTSAGMSGATGTSAATHGCP